MTSPDHPVMGRMSLNWKGCKKGFTRSGQFKLSGEVGQTGSFFLPLELRILRGEPIKVYNIISS